MKPPKGWIEVTLAEGVTCSKQVSLIRGVLRCASGDALIIYQDANESESGEVTDSDHVQESYEAVMELIREAQSDA